jgi:hypothetical protein
LGISHGLPSDAIPGVERFSALGTQDLDVAFLHFFFTALDQSLATSAVDFLDA